MTNQRHGTISLKPSYGDALGRGAGGYEAHLDHQYPPLLSPPSQLITGVDWPWFRH
jgi:hypothetical protein